MQHGLPLLPQVIVIEKGEEHSWRGGEEGETPLSVAELVVVEHDLVERITLGDNLGPRGSYAPEVTMKLAT